MDIDNELLADLRAAVRGEVHADVRRRAEYSSDASNYRVVPQVVATPLDTDDVLAALAVSRQHSLPVTCRGGGTSVAGNAVGPGLVLDFSRHLNRIVDLDPAARTAVVQPGVILADLQRAAAPHGLRFGPDPSTHARATLGGMIGNNACGPHAVAYGRTADNVRELRAVDGTGRRFSTVEPVDGLNALIDRHLSVIRTEFGRFSRQVSGYSLEHLLPENGRNLARALVGTEGTLAVTLDATVSLVPVSPARLLVVLGYPDMATAGDAVPGLLPHRPLAVEGLDARLVDLVRSHRGGVPELPAGGGWLMIEVGGADTAEAQHRAEQIVRDSQAADHVVLPRGPAATAMWRIREDGAGLAGRTPSGQQAWPGWEDAAVPPGQLGAYLRDFDALLDEFGLEGLPYGHFGDGCVHVRLGLPLERDASVFRSFLTAAADLVVGYGGSFSGEHGDGRARGELLPRMYSTESIALFGAVKDLFDPDDLLNPGVVVRPHPLDADLRRPRARPLPVADGFSFSHDGGDFTRAVHRCVGVGKCRADNRAAGGFMCPSYLATRDEKDSTRGRARVLQEVANGSLVSGWSDAAVHESLDLCLSCKACASDCPAGVDLAQYKSEALHRKYRRKLRPVSHYTLGRLPDWIRLLHRFPVLGPLLVNALMSLRPVEKVLLALSGVDPRRHAPRFARRSFTKSRRRVRDEGPQVVLWADSFSDGMDTDVAEAVAEVLADAGYRVIVPPRRPCCGLTWITTGQLDTARRKLRELVETLRPYATAGLPIVGVEPSCTAVLRSDLLDLFPDDSDAKAVSGAVTTLAELLSITDGWEAPDLSGVQLVAQPHCHQHSVLGFESDRALLEAAGARLQTLAGCCGLAGNFGMERGHYEVSVAVAENALLPALREKPDAVFLADGFSCRTQADQLAGVRGLHLAQLLAHPPEKRP
ncbi:FAD-binding and (Fe-S)-binding domain-containing protein [Amycolatopsis benzoatilytica]|uniref:FAD-binding and (Fe-S)-binding domain-containing protein n=1 Tax=Amycolatopsis benzoatilytica TaxID=346045 RepID=UPI00035C58C2|nr:FAD-binding and (Fe-S)-binding domain-containing protein [Amycolatopsis benzoatilytica]